MARCGARGSVAKAIPYDAQVPYQHIKFVGFRVKLAPIDAEPIIRGEHLPDLVQAEAGGSAKGNERQAVQH